MLSRIQHALAATRGAMLALFLLALANRLALVAAVPFDGLYGQDAYAYYEYARVLRDALAHAQFPPPFWWSLAYPLLLNTGFLLGGMNASAAQFITLLCGALVAPFAFGLAHESAPMQKMVAGWVAGLVCALSGQLAQSSVVIMADAPALMFATLGAWRLVRYANTRAAAFLMFASFAVGMAVWTRWQNLIFAGVWFAALLVVEYRAARFSRTSLARVLLALAIVALVLMPQFLVNVSVRAPLAGQSWLEGWSPMNSFARTFDNPDGHFEYALPVALFYAQAVAHPAYLFLLLTPLCGIGFLVLGKRINALPHLFVLLAGWILGMYFFLAGIPYENFRFMLGYLTPAAVLTGVGAGWMWARWNSKRAHASMAAWITLALVVMVYWQPRVLAPVWESKAQQLAQARWLEMQLLPNALLYTMSIDGAVHEYTKLRVENLWDMDPAKLESETPTYVYADTKNIDSQWHGKLPDQLLRALSETNFLHPLGSYNGWTLFRVRDCKYRVLDCE